MCCTAYIVYFARDIFKSSDYWSRLSVTTELFLACTHEGLEYNNGQEWRSRSNRCETCRCENGVVSCRPSIRCVVKCPHGVVRTGECCPDCSGMLSGNRSVSKVNMEITIRYYYTSCENIAI